MLYFKNKLVYEKSSFSSLGPLKLFVQTVPGLKDKVFDSAETQEIPDNCFAYFKDTKNKDAILYFIKSKITVKELANLAEKSGFQLDGNYLDPSSKKVFTIKYRGMTINCKWSGGPSGASNTTKYTELSEYATKIALESGSVLYNDDDQVAVVMQFLYEKIEKDYPALLSKHDIDKLLEEYAISGLKSAAEFFSKYGIDPDYYDFDRQLEDPRSMVIYAKALSLGASSKDNWNPGDIWAFDQSLTVAKIKSDINGFTTLAELNAYIDNMMGGRENDDLSAMQIIPISLKKVSLKKPVHIERMDSDKATEIISNILNEGLFIDKIYFISTFKRFNIELSNGYLIQVFNSTGGVGSTRWELQKPGSGAKCGNIDKAEWIIPYIFEGNNESEIQQSLFGTEPEQRTEFYKFVDKIYSLKNHNLIKQSKSELIKSYDQACDNALKSGDNTYPNTIVTEVVALYYCIKNITKVINGKPLINEMFLSGLKIADNQCSYIKIYSA